MIVHCSCLYFVSIVGNGQISWDPPTSHLWPFPWRQVPWFLSTKTIRVSCCVCRHSPKPYLVSATWCIFIFYKVYFLSNQVLKKKCRNSFWFLSIWSRLLTFSHWGSVNFVTIRYFCVLIFVPKQYDWKSPFFWPTWNGTKMIMVWSRNFGTVSAAHCGFEQCMSWSLKNLDEFWSIFRNLQIHNFFITDFV